MLKLEVFDSSMCCSTGICGSNADPILITFASDLEWLKKNGVDVVRYGLLLQPSEFTKNKVVSTILNKEGNGCLPILIINNEIASKNCYPSREKLAKICQIKYNKDEAPSIHREENCCCGVDCDCSTAHPTKRCNETLKNKYDYNADGSSLCDYEENNYGLKKDTYNKTLFIFFLFVIVALMFLWNYLADAMHS